ncbi:ABC transporter permease [Pedobacter psychroterrae]|uniref:ABC transporter permease n=1 Tax=Pedobacter psychroterrae TaxID=2530453 RepID=A0A4R0NIL5_9SPHI|nr:ABC transporter permease [Pedobacter psychroterrae]TCD00326.1 ABC transporter permease [Pedobacter psychroterrae]
MFRHHLLLAYRNFKRYKSSFFINLIGLTAGLSCTLLIYLWVNDEVQMDGFHDKTVYQVMQNEHITERVNTVDGTPGILAEALAKEVPDVATAVTTSPAYWLAKSKIALNGKPPVNAAGKFAGKDFFKVFSYPLLSGSADKVLAEKNTVVVSEALAMKLFNSLDVIGREVIWTNAEMEAESHALISGVFKNVLRNSSDQFDFLVSLDVLLTAGNATYAKWNNYGPNTFVSLKKDADPNLFNTRIRDFLKEKGVKDYTLFIRPYADSYLYNQFENGVVAGGRIDYIKLFSLIAVFILIIACINFMNLSTAKASRRLKEIGVKKVMGVSRRSLMLQYLSESMMLSLIAMFVSLLIVELALPQFNNMTAKHLSLSFSPGLVFPLLGITIFTGLISGSYPAIYLSGLKPAAALKGKIRLTSGAMWTRQGLVVFQFAVSVILIVAVLIIHKQVEYVQTKNQGYQKDNVLYFETAGKFNGNAGFAVEQIKKIPGVVNASSINREFLGDLSYTTGVFNWEGRDPKEVIKFQRADVSTGLIETLGIQMAAGRSFSEKFTSDTSKIIINEAGIKVMRLRDPVGKIFTLWGEDMQIIGVIKDFHFESMHQQIKPMFIRYKPTGTNRIMVKIASGKVKEALAGLGEFNKTYNPGFPLDYKFLDQDFQAQYVAETRVSLLSGYFAVLAVLISCLGLFGLASFTAERRFKEIGIRKVLGATNLSVVYILSRDFTKPVLIGILIALPIGYVFSRLWLASFAYKIELQLWFFMAAGFMALLISLITVIFQAYKAAGINPVQAIRAD